MFPELQWPKLDTALLWGPCYCWKDGKNARGVLEAGSFLGVFGVGFGFLVFFFFNSMTILNPGQLATNTALILLKYLQSLLD